MDLGGGDRVVVPDAGATTVPLGILVRPGHMRAGGSEDERTSRVAGTITDVVYLGSMTELIAGPKTEDEVTIQELNDDFKGALRQVGDRVVVRWAAEHSFIIGDEAGPVPGEDGRPAPGGETLEIAREGR